MDLVQMDSQLSNLSKHLSILQSYLSLKFGLEFQEFYERSSRIVPSGVDFLNNKRSQETSNADNETDLNNEPHSTIEDMEDQEDSSPEYITVKTEIDLDDLITTASRIDPLIMTKEERITPDSDFEDNDIDNVNCEHQSSKHLQMELVEGEDEIVLPDNRDSEDDGQDPLYEDPLADFGEDESNESDKNVPSTSFRKTKKVLKRTRTFKQSLKNKIFKKSSPNAKNVAVVIKNEDNGGSESGQGDLLKPNLKYTRSQTSSKPYINQQPKVKDRPTKKVQKRKGSTDFKRFQECQYCKQKVDTNTHESIRLEIEEQSPGTVNQETWNISQKYSCHMCRKAYNTTAEKLNNLWSALLK